MDAVILVVVFLLVLLGAGIGLILLRRARSVPTTAVEETRRVDPLADAARHRRIEEQGSELLERRVDLDARRGTLAGDSGVYEAFDRLEAEFRAGIISEGEFEAGKIRILGG